MNFSLLFDDSARYVTRPDRYAERFAIMERLAVEEGIDVDSMELSVAERLWAQAEA